MTVLSARGIYKWFGRRVLTAAPTGWGHDHPTTVAVLLGEAAVLPGG